MSYIYVSTTGNDTTGDGSAGNPYATPGKAGSVMAGGDVLRIRAGTYNAPTNTSNVAGGYLTPPAGSAGAPTVVEGYNSTPGDLDDVNDWSNSPVLRATGTINWLINIPNNYVFTRNISINGNALATYGLNAGGTNLVLANLKSAGAGNTGFNVASGGAAISFFRCLASGTVTGFGLNGYVVDLADCIATGNTAAGFNASNNYVVTFSRCIAHANAGGSTDGFTLTGNVWGSRLSACVSYNNGRDGVRFADAGSAAAASVLNCILAQNGGYGLNSAVTNWSAGPCPTFDRNGFYSNTSGARNQLPAGTNDVTCSGNPFTNAAAGDFSLNATAGAGAALRAAGFPGVMPGGLTTGYADIGAAQHQDAGGGGTTTNYIINQVINKYFVNDEGP